MASQEHPVRARIESNVGWLEFNRPPVNAIDAHMLGAIHDGLAAALADREVRVLVLASTLDAYFSAGADLRAFKSLGREGMGGWVAQCHAITRLLRGSPKPVLAAIAGTAVGGGLEMTLHCDVRFAAANARFGQPEINIAFIPPVGATQALARLLGRPRALRYLYEGRMLDAAEALGCGLIDEIVPGDLKQRVQQYAEQLAARPAQALAAIRRTVTIGGGLTFDQGLTLEFETATALAESADFHEGVQAFLEKRAPSWQR